KSLSREDSVLCSTLSRLPLIHPRWTVAGQGALYRYVKLWTADRCKAFQDSLTMYPNNGIHVRAIMIHWGRRISGVQTAMHTKFSAGFMKWKFNILFDYVLVCNASTQVTTRSSSVKKVWPRWGRSRRYV